MYTIKGNGTREYGKKIIKFFESLGAINNNFSAKFKNIYYAINEYNEIDSYEYKPKNLKEVELLENGMAKGVWYKCFNDWYIKPNRLDKGVYGETISGEENKYILNNGYSGGFQSLNYLYEENATPLTDLTEIQQYLPDGHEDKVINEQNNVSLQPEPKIIIDSNDLIIKNYGSIKKAIKQLKKLIK
jgi:hypothetical protein